MSRVGGARGGARPAASRLALLGSFALLACGRGGPERDGGARSQRAASATLAAVEAPLVSSVRTAGVVASASPTAQAVPAAPAADYPWRDEPGALPAHDDLQARFAPPPGFALEPAAPGSFAEFLRRLPLAAPATPVRSFRGDVLVAAGDPRLAAVTTLDVGTRDLQQCADAILRLYAEYKYSRGREAQLVFRANSGFAMPWSRWAAGERFRLQGKDLAWGGQGAGGRGRRNFRSWLDAVFTYANTASLARDNDPVARTELTAGDFFVQAGYPGHAVLVLAVASDGRGHRRALIGQSYMPAQNFQVLAQGGEAWFSLDDDSVQTPFWAAFGWRDARRLR